MDEKHEAPLKRRQFLKWVSGVIASLLAAIYAIPAIAYILGDSLKEKEQTWLKLGSVDKVPLNTPTLFKTRMDKQTGWISASEEIFVYILSRDGREYIAMSNICTHLGCRVRWIEGKQQFYCPCHNGVYDIEGNVVSGPPPRPLDRFPVKVEENHISILAA